MTSEEFKDKLEALWDEYNKNHDKEFLMAIVEFDRNDEPSGLDIMGAGCPCCIIDFLNEEIQEGKLQHKDKNLSRKVH